MTERERKREREKERQTERQTEGEGETRNNNEIIETARLFETRMKMLQLF